MPLRFREMRDGGACPYRPMAQQAARKTKLLAAEIIGGEQVEQNIVVVAGVQRYFVGAPGFGEGADDIESLVAVKRGNFYGHNIFDVTKFAPERIWQEHARQRSAANKIRLLELWKRWRGSVQAVLR